MNSETLSLKTVIDKLNFSNKIVIIQWNIRKKDQKLFGTKITEKLSDPSNAKEYYNSYFKRKNKKSVKRSKITTE